MAETLNTNMVTVALPTAADIVTVMVAPTGANGGGITILDAYAVNHAATSGTASFTLQLIKGGTAAAFSANGTISGVLAGTAASGTAGHWADQTRKQFSGLGTAAFVAAGEQVAIDYTTLNGGSHTRGYVNIHYVTGRSI